MNKISIIGHIGVGGACTDSKGESRHGYCRGRGDRMEIIIIGGFGDKWGGNRYKPGRRLYSVYGICPTLTSSGEGYEGGGSKLILEVMEDDPS